MSARIKSVLQTVVLLTFLPVLAIAGDHPATASDHPAPTVDDQMKGLQTMCSEAADAQAERQAAKSLYERLGGYDSILEITTEIVRLHSINDQIKHTLDGVDHKMLAKHVADFVAAGTGGDEEYTGRDLPSSHVHLKLTDADFLSAGGDVMQAMKNLEHGQEEIEEVVCILVSLKDQVVFK